MERSLNNEGTTNFILVSEDGKGSFLNISELGYNNIRLSTKSCEGLIIGYYKLKKEIKEDE